MYRNTEKLLRGSPVSALSHPLLVGLLELAAQGAGIGSDVRLEQRMARDWKKVCTAFQRCCNVGVSDDDVRKALPLPGISHSNETGWGFPPGDLMDFRRRVASALEVIADSRGVTLQSFTITSIRELRTAMRRNRIPFPDSPAMIKPTIETAMLPGRRFVVSSMLLGWRVFTALQSDEFGRLKVIAHETTKRLAVRRCDENLS